MSDSDFVFNLYVNGVYKKKALGQEVRLLACS